MPPRLAAAAALPARCCHCRVSRPEQLTCRSCSPYVAELTEKETIMLNYSLDMQVLPKLSATPGQQLTTEQQEAKAVANREAAAAQRLSGGRA